MAYETTKVPVVQSQSEIRRMLMKYGGTGVAFISQPPMEGFEGMIPIDGITYKIRIAASVPENSKDVDYETRRIWRVLYWHLKSVFESAATGVLEFREMMLPYIVVRDNRTIGQHILPELKKAVEGRPERLLPGPAEEINA